MSPIRTHFVALAVGFAAGVITATPHWSRHYLNLGATLAVLSLAVCAALFAGRRP